MRTRIFLSFAMAASAVLLANPPAWSQQEAATRAAGNQEQAKDSKRELKLEDLFPERSFFGPSATGTSFSVDGRYAAYLYRPYLERRHGNDLWILDTETGEVERLTSVVVMAEFQESTRRVKTDREEKARKAGIGKRTETKKDDSEIKAETDRQDEVRRDEERQDVEIDDPVTGTWEGRITGGADIGLPPEGLPFRLTMKLESNDAVTGSMAAMGQTIDLSGGMYDRAVGIVTASVVDESTGIGVGLSMNIRDDELTGTVDVTAMGVALEIIGMRTTREIDADGAQMPHADPIAQERRRGERRTTGQRTDDERQQDDEQQEQKEEEQDQGDRRDNGQVILGNWVSDKDAEDSRAPRYSGIQSFVWSPTADELIFISQGDLYRYIVEDGSITRLTRTNDSMRGVQYLPDGTGFTYSGSSGLQKVTFGSHLIEHLEPSLPSGERMIGYEISPNGRRMVFLTSRSTGSTPTQTVEFMTFRGRFAQVRQVSRQVSDDPRSKTQYAVYLYDLGDPWSEDTTLKKVFTHDVSGPRDVLQTPEWAPDSSKVAWSRYLQESGLVEIYEARFREVKDKAGNNDTSSNAKQGDGEDESVKIEIDDARMVYRFLHHGGPTTPRMIHPYYLADSHHLTFITELSGFRHVHVLDPVYESLRQVTFGHYEVYPFGKSDDHRKLFVTATKEHPTREDVYSIDLESGEMVRLSRADGVYSTVAIGNCGSKALARHSTYGNLPELHYMCVASENQRQLTDSHPDLAREMTEPTPEFFTYKNRHGHQIHGHMFKPDDWSPQDKRPLLIYVYGGPLGTRKQVVDGSYGAPNYFFGYYMAKKHGYVTVTIDPRGVSGFGAVFEKANYDQVGKPQVEDLVDGVRWLIEHHGVDEDRIGIHGWSFGGFQTQMCLYTEPDVFHVGIAGAGPTEWENYNQWYTTGTIFDTQAIGRAELEKFSLLPLAKNLKGQLLLIHGMEDANVLYQDTVKVYRELLKAGKETNVELFLDPTGGHGLGGDVKTINRYRKYEDFLVRYLGKGKPAEVVAASE